MQVIFIHHSCFLVEADDQVLIFDYIRPDRLDGYRFTGRIPTYAPETRIRVFVSHSHKDHYDPVIFTWAKDYPNIHYFLAEDIPAGPADLKKLGLSPSFRDRITRVKPHKTYEYDGLSIETLKSNEAGVNTLHAGVAFYVNANGISMFHGGDLADWCFEGVGELMNNRMKKSFRAELRRLSGKPLNLAFVAMDPRQEQDMSLTVEEFLKNTDAEYIFPMHMWQDYSGIPLYRKRLTNRESAARVMVVERENQVFFFGEETL